MINLLDTIALLDDIPEAKLRRGSMGTIVEVLAEDVFEVEFSDSRTGATYAMLPLRADQLMVLHHSQ